MGSAWCRSSHGDARGMSERVHRHDSDGACDAVTFVRVCNLYGIFDYTIGQWTSGPAHTTLLMVQGVRRCIVCVTPVAHGRVQSHKSRAFMRCHEMNDLCQGRRARSTAVQQAGAHLPTCTP